MPTSRPSNNMENDKHSEPSDSCRDKAEREAEKKWQSAARIEGYSIINSEIEQKAKDQRPIGRSAATKNALHSFESLTGPQRITNPLDWMSHGGDTLARQVAERTSNSGLMILGPADTMRAQAEKYKDPNGYFPVFTHADRDDFHMYFGLHQGRKEYSVKAMAEMIRNCVPPGQAIRLLGCESGIDGKGGVAQQVARLLPDNPLFAPNGYCEVKGGSATVYLKKPSGMKPVPNPIGIGYTYPETPRGQFVRIKPEK